MSKKYLSLEETAAALRVSRDELIRMREKGDIRGFADRGTWKFREEDVQQVRRSRQADSDPEVPLLLDDESVIGDDLADEPTIITKGGDALSTSDSEVKLMGSIALEGLIPDDSDSDSDVKLMGDPASDIGLVPDAPDTSADDDLFFPQADSESDVQIVSIDNLESDSDVALLSESSGELQLGPLDDELGSDSDVRLVADAKTSSGSDSEVKIVKPDAHQRTSDSDVALLADDDDAVALDFTPGDGESASVLSDESGLALTGDDSAMLLQSESGLQLRGSGNSDINLADIDDESITLDIAGDSGISLEVGTDSGISLESVADSGISLEDPAGFSGTVPMMNALGGAEDSETAFEIPALKSEDDSEFELSASGSSDNETAVFDLAGAEQDLDDAVFDIDDAEASDDVLASSDFDDDDVDLSADDVLGEDDELDELDVFDADEDAFDDAGPATSGGQKFASPVGAVVVEQEWGGGTFFGLLLSTAMLAVLGIVMFDLIHNMWAYQQPTSASSMLLDSLRGLYK